MFVRGSTIILSCVVKEFMLREQWRIGKKKEKEKKNSGE